MSWDTGTRDPMEASDIDLMRGCLAIARADADTVAWALYSLSKRVETLEGAIESGLHPTTGTPINYHPNAMRRAERKAWPNADTATGHHGGE